MLTHRRPTVQAAIASFLAADYMNLRRRTERRKEVVKKVQLDADDIRETVGDGRRYPGDEKGGMIPMTNHPRQREHARFTRRLSPGGRRLRAKFRQGEALL